MSTMLEVKDLSISFGGIKAVQGVSFQIEDGEIVGLIGPNGSGKSTCINLISGVNRPDNGKVIFDGQELTDQQDIADRSKLGMGRTFQSPRPFANLTVYDNIFSIAIQKYDRATAAKKTEDILKMTGLYPVSSLLSSKLPIEKRKWLDLARILATDPKFIMMDEVMAGLNPSEMQESLELVLRINREGVTVLFVEHVMKAVVHLCGRAIVLNEGKLLCEGEPGDVLGRKEVVEAYLGGGHKHA